MMDTETYIPRSLTLSKRSDGYFEVHIDIEDRDIFYKIKDKVGQDPMTTLENMDERVAYEMIFQFHRMIRTINGDSALASMVDNVNAYEDPRYRGIVQFFVHHGQNIVMVCEYLSTEDVSIKDAEARIKGDTSRKIQDSVRLHRRLQTIKFFHDLPDNFGLDDL